MIDLDKDKVIGLLNEILEHELAGVVQYTHYSFLVFGHNRIPIVSWLREQAAESLTHAEQAGEMITLLGAAPLCRRVLCSARRIRSTDGLCRGAACGRGGQDASYPRRSGCLPTCS